MSGGVSGGVIGRHSTRLVSFVQRTSRKLGGVLLNFGKSAAYQQYGYGIPLVRLLTTAAVITYQTGMLQEPSFLGTNIMLVLGKLYVSTVGTTLHIATVHPKALPGSPKGTSSPACSVRTRQEVPSNAAHSGSTTSGFSNAGAAVSPLFKMMFTTLTASVMVTLPSLLVSPWMPCTSMSAVAAGESK